MATSIVNGYYCASSCDVAKAKKGENPHPSTDTGGVKDQDKDNNPLQADGPAVLFGGALSALSADAIQPTSDASATDPAAARRAGQAVDILA
jgi:hypothetical protein